MKDNCYLIQSGSRKIRRVAHGFRGDSTPLPPPPLPSPTAAAGTVSWSFHGVMKRGMRADRQPLKERFRGLFHPRFPRLDARTRLSSRIILSECFIVCCIDGMPSGPKISYVLLDSTPGDVLFARVGQRRDGSRNCRKRERFTLSRTF